MQLSEFTVGTRVITKVRCGDDTPGAMYDLPPGMIGTVIAFHRVSGVAVVRLDDNHPTMTDWDNCLNVDADGNAPPENFDVLSQPINSYNDGSGYWYNIDPHRCGEIQWAAIVRSEKPKVITITEHKTADEARWAAQAAIAAHRSSEHPAIKAWRDERDAKKRALGFQ